ncbi:MAG: collagen-binding domain-containing protein, partial [Clostridium sp.]|uniref:collagen-binding domain-containing protein n=1 Tax=Clostridium sp. TaxID=1506 RepID=UPI003F3FBB54
MNRGRLSLIIAGAVVATSLQTGIMASAQNINTKMEVQNKAAVTNTENKAEKLMGTINDYGAIVFGNASFVKGDSETPFAIGGNLSAPTEGILPGNTVASSFTLVTANEKKNGGSVVVGNPINMENKSGLLLGGTLDPNGLKAQEGTGNIGNLIIDAPDVVVAEGGDPYKQLKTSENWNQTKVNYLSKEVIAQKFEDFKKEADKTVSNAKKVVENKASQDVVNQVGYKTLPSTNGITNMKEVDVSTEQITGKTLVVYSDAKTVNINAYSLKVDGKTISYKTPLSERNQIASHILYVFPNATSVNMKQSGVYGSILAPNATLTLDGGAVNGQVIVENLNQSKGGEIHSFNFDWNAFNKLFKETPKTITVTYKDGDNIIVPAKTVTGNTGNDTGLTTSVPDGYHLVNITDGKTVINELPKTFGDSNSSVVVNIEKNAKITVKMVYPDGTECGKEQVATG